MTDGMIYYVKLDAMATLLMTQFSPQNLTLLVTVVIRFKIRGSQDLFKLLRQWFYKR